MKPGRYFENQDPILEPRTGRSLDDARNGVDRSFTGDINTLATTVGGGTVHWDVKVPRFWRQDFDGFSRYGPVEGANLADWPLTYDELAPFYDDVEAQLGVQGDVHAMPASTLAQAPRLHQFAMKPNPPILARGGAAVSFLHPARVAGAKLLSRCFVTRVDLARDGKLATGSARPAWSTSTSTASPITCAPTSSSWRRPRSRLHGSHSCRRTRSIHAGSETDPISSAATSCSISSRSASACSVTKHTRRADRRAPSWSTTSSDPIAAPQSAPPVCRTARAASSSSVGE